MKKNVVEKIEKEIREKIEIPTEIKNDLRKEAFRNIVIAIIVVSYFTFLILGSVGTIKSIRTIDFNIFSFLTLILAICLFEISYRKENGKLAVFGIEALITAIFTLFLPYIIFELDQTYKKYYLMISGYVAIYYIIKCIAIYIKGKKAYMKQVSDIKEIVKKEKNKHDRNNKEMMEFKQTNEELQEKTVRKNSKKNNKNLSKKRNAKQKENKEAKNAKANIEIKSESIKNNEKQNIARKKNNNRKANTSEKAKSAKTQEIVNANMPKKRGRPKKEETLKKEQQNKNENNEPKKRGRTRKVVTSK